MSGLHFRTRSRREREFEALYADDPDPWGMETSDYEAGKYDATLAALNSQKYQNALEVGCSVGVLTARLAQRCHRLLALDVSETALGRARQRPGTANVEWRRAEVPSSWPSARHNLIVLSEVLYFLEPTEVDMVASLASRDLLPGGEVIVVNWLGECDRTLNGNEASERFLREAEWQGLACEAVERTEHYRIDRAVRRTAR